MKRVTAIPATSKRQVEVVEKRKVAAYARVSTDHEEQLTSYAAQVDYYTQYIKGRVDWDFAGIYTDEGISGTSTKKREGFNRMIADALDGKINLIVTKSVSRFARNTVDSLSTIRSLKEHGIECYFEKENIWTFDGKGELLITIMSSLAQEESRSISENITWGQRKKMADGKLSLSYSRFLGYDKGEDGTLIINPEQAITVRHIYGMFLSDMTPAQIARKLTADGVPTPSGGEKWLASSVKSILTNEKYKGDALLQKTYTVDFLSKKKKVNEGEVPQYYVEGCHEAIIDPEIFDYVQALFATRYSSYRSSTSVFSGKIKCACCGSWYGPKVWHSTDKYRRVIWQCNHKFAGQKCTSPHLTEDEIQRIFLERANCLIAKKDIISACTSSLEVAFSWDVLEERQQKLTKEMEAIADEIDGAISENKHAAHDQDAYQKRYDALVERYNTAKMESMKLGHRIAEKKGRLMQARQFLESLKEHDILTEFHDADFVAMVDYLEAGDTVRVVFKDGTVI